MKKHSKILILVTWGTLIYILFKLNLLNADENNLSRFFNEYGQYKAILFVVLSTFRVLALIPSTVFMILGGVMFNPLEGFFLTILSIILSETIIYVLSKVLLAYSAQAYLVSKYPKLYKLMLRSNTRILALGILCPAAPSDVACFLASSTGLSYRKFIITVILANMPMAALYSFLGKSMISSLTNSIVIGIIVLLVSIYSIYLWSKEQNKYKIV